MGDSYKRLSKDDAALLLVDHQSGLLALADLARDFRLPTILTTSFDAKAKK
jgi:hypothetical protein